MRTIFVAFPSVVTAAVLGLAGAPLAACSSTAPPSTGHQAVECASDTDCNGNQQCVLGVCEGPDAGRQPDAEPDPDAAADHVNPPEAGPAKDSGPMSDDGGVCVPTSQPCTDNGMCCNWRKHAGYCVDFGSGGECADSCVINSDCKSGCCAATTSGNSVCSPPSACAPPPPPLGAPCSASSQCSSGTCANGGSGLGWCTEGCTSNQACPNSPYPMWCVQNGGGVDICFTACITTSDCSAYGSASYCSSVTTVDGFQTSVCVN